MQRVRFIHRFHGLETPARPLTYEWMVSVICSCESFATTPLFKQALIRTIGRLFAAGCPAGSSSTCSANAHGCMVNARCHLQAFAKSLKSSARTPSADEKSLGATARHSDKGWQSMETCCSCSPAKHARLHGLAEAMSIVLTMEDKVKDDMSARSNSFALFPGTDLNLDYSAVKMIALETERYLAAQERVDLVTSSACLLKHFLAPA